MRTFNAISVWLLWSMAFLLCLGYLFILAMNVVQTVPAPGPPEQVAGYTKLFWVSLAVMATLSAFMCFGIRHFWFRRSRSPGVGFWFSTLFLFLLVVSIPASGFAPYFAVSDRSALQWVSLAVGGFFLVICFPRLPAPRPRSQATMTT